MAHMCQMAPRTGLMEIFLHKTRQHGQIAYFGYGSLVNPATHRTNIIGTIKVRLKGWRREWLVRPNNSFGAVALLSAKRDETSEIDGLVVLDHAANQAALDARENNYNRHIVDSGSITILETKANGGETCPAELDTSIYVAMHIPEPDNYRQFKILRSYLDAVMQGYFSNFGEEGVARFVQSTDNFDMGVREDRHNPVYPRSVVTTKKEQALFERFVPNLE